ncbi:MAG: polymerase subunit alpha, partial [Pseudonocardiales bacterium]|nr:polymerase subunit alpha [Pseudonocardiales bacterium]
EDLEGSIEVMFFPATYAQVALHIAEDAIVAVKGRTDAREDTVKLIATELSVLDTTVTPRGPVLVRMAPARCTPPLVDRLKDVLATHPGTTEVHLQLVQGDRQRVLRLGDGYRVTPSPALMGDLKALLGPAAVSG